MARRKGPVDPNAEYQEDMAHYYKTHPQPHDNVNRNQYKQPIGPKQVDPNQYSHAIGPTHPHASADSQQHTFPPGPEQRQYTTNANQYPAPIGPRTRGQTAFDKIRNAGRAAYDAGAQAAQVGRDIGNNPHVQQIRRQDGFAAPVSAVPRHPTSRQEYPGAPIDPNSVMHPGNRLVVMKCNDATGKCRTIATGISMEKSSSPKQEKRRPWQQGGLGGDDPGF